MKIRTSAAICFLGLTICAGCKRRWPESYAPPAQLAFIPEEPGSMQTVVSMDDMNIDDFVVHDVQLGGSETPWRWSFERPELHFTLDQGRLHKAVMEFAVAGATFHDTGPVTVSFFVNGHAAGTLRCEKSGKYQFEADVPAEWVKEKPETSLAAQIKPPWISPNDGTRLGVILVRAGFVRR